MSEGFAMESSRGSHQQPFEPCCALYVLRSVHLTISLMVVAGCREEIRKAIPGIVACLKDSQWGVREAAIYGLSNLAAHCMCYYLFPFDIVNHIHSWIAWRVSSEDIGIH